MTHRRQGTHLTTLCKKCQNIPQCKYKEKRVWVTYKEGVYDITDFIVEHPGGEQILLAAGSSVEPFWMLYAVHNNSHVLHLLENLRIGNLSKDESQDLTSDMSDPYNSDPLRHTALQAASVKPFNAETPPISVVSIFYKLTLTESIMQPR
jgi:sulfite oxidase